MRVAGKLVAVLFALGGCAGVEDDPSLHLTGTEEAAILLDDGTLACDAPKVLVCHIPPGNPGNAHEICVAAAAVRAHQRLHDDPVGACEELVEPPLPPGGCSDPAGCDETPEQDPVCGSDSCGGEDEAPAQDEPQSCIETGTCDMVVS
jgi:hypothetical protein